MISLSPTGSVGGRAETASVAWRVSTVSQEIVHTSSPHLSRTLGLWAIVGLGLGYMTPMTVFDTFGIVSGETNAVVPLAYIARWSR